MSRRPRVTGAELIAALTRLGFVPVHAAEIIGPGLLNIILRDCRIEAEDLSTP